jgi:hypothetical protein
MVSQSVWGPHIWKFFHSLTIKLNPTSYPNVGNQLFFYIKRFCGILPCPECSMHSKHFFSRINDKSINTKEKLVNLIYIFHNNVNVRKKKPIFDYNNITNLYENNNLIQLYNIFVSVYNVKGNLNQINESFHRQKLLMEFKKWFMLNYKHFTFTTPKLQVKQISLSSIEESKKEQIQEEKQEKQND